MTSYELVQFNDGYYGIRRKRFLRRADFASSSTGFYWRNPEDIRAFCRFQNKEDAINALSYIDSAQCYKVVLLDPA